MKNIEAQLKRFRNEFQRYQTIFVEYKKYMYGLAFEKSIIGNEKESREKLNQMWGGLENTIIKLWSERPKLKQYNEVFPIFETALSGDFKSSLTGVAIEKAIQVVIICIGKVKSKAEISEHKTEQVENEKIDYDKKEPQDKAQMKDIQSIDSNKKWFSMDNPPIWVIASLIVFAIVYYFFAR